jgi:hypothetical protein
MPITQKCEYVHNIVKFHGLPTWPTIDQTNVVHDVVVMHNKKRFFN